MTEYVASELRRIIGKIPETDPATMEYHVLLQSLEIFANISESVEQLMDTIHSYSDEPPEDGKIIKVEFRPSPELMQQVADMTQAEDEPSDEPEESFLTTGPTGSPAPETKMADVVETEETEPARVWEMTEVRAALVEARRKGVNVSALLREFGVENFGAFPAGKYGELMKRLEG
jgi:hypothetical protein